MAHTTRFKAKKDFKLDCGHEVKAGEEFIVTKTFTCDFHAATIPFQTKEIRAVVQK